MGAARQKVVILLFLAIAAALTGKNQVRAAAGGPQICYPSQQCTLGEFLYNDEYQSITNASCTLTSKYPDGSAHLTNQSLSVRDDGWYYYNFITPQTPGYYSAQICCQADGDYLCLDKSFEVKENPATPTPAPTVPSSQEIASAVWNYSGRTLTSFGDLVSNIWSASSRTLSSFGDLISGIWSHSNRTLTDSSLSSGNLATKNDIANLNNFVSTASGELAVIKNQVNETRLLVEKVVNKPIIESTFEEVEDKDLGEKIKQTKTLASQIEINNQFLFTKTTSLVQKWSQLNEREILDILIEMNEVLGEEGENSSYLGKVFQLRQFWGWAVVDDLGEQAQAIKKTLSFIQQGISSYGKTNTLLKETKSLLTYLKTAQKILGESTDKPSQKSLYAKINDTEKIALILEERLAEAESYLKESENPSPLFKLKVEDFLKKVVAINRLPRVNNILGSNNWSGEKKFKNQILTARGVLQANKKLLVNGENKPLSSIWFEEGSIVIKTLISNPSTLITQEVPLKFYLPEEIKSETDIISVDEGVVVKFDTEKNQYYIEGKFTLRPGETKTLAVRLKDNWEIDSAQIESLRKQAEELSRPLEKTAYFAQAVTLKSDINASLDKIELLKKGIITPEQKIKAYREAQIEFKAVNEKMEKLKELVTTASGATGLLGFVGGSQAIAVWGIIVVVAVGFIFLAISLRKIGGGINNSQGNNQEEKNQKDSSSENNFSSLNSPRERKRKLIGFILPLILAIIFSSGISVAALKFLDKRKNSESVSQVKGVEDEQLGKGGVEVVLLTSKEEKVPLYSQPAEDSEIKEYLKNNTEVIKTNQKGDWLEILLVKNISPYQIQQGWVKKEVTKEAITQEVPPSLTVVIKETPTGWLRVRETPGGKEIGKVYPGEVYSFLGQDKGWYQIEFGEKEGWISGDYAEINEEKSEEE